MLYTYSTEQLFYYTLGMWITQIFDGRIIGGWYKRIIDYSMCADIHKYYNFKL
jgi:hypothetical protein